MQNMPTIQVGGGEGTNNSAWAVESLQRALLRAGFDTGPVDGGFDAGSQPDIAVRNFQTTNGIVANGIVGPDTWAALPDEDNQGLPALALGAQGGAVALVQRCLRRGGFYTGFISGVFDAQTQAAMIQCQQNLALPVVDGTVGDQNSAWSFLP